jgi:hypothetical protein
MPFLRDERRKRSVICAETVVYRWAPDRSFAESAIYGGKKSSLSRFLTPLVTV